MADQYKNKVMDFKATFKVGDVVEGHSTCKLYWITAIGNERWLGIDHRGKESVRTISPWNEWRLPDAKRRDDFIVWMKTEVFK